MHKIARLSAFLMAACLCQAVAQDMCPQYLLDSAMTVNIEGRFINAQKSRASLDIEWRHHPEALDTFFVNFPKREAIMFVTAGDSRYEVFSQQKVKRQLGLHHLRDNIGNTPLKLDDLELLANGLFMCRDSSKSQKIFSTAFSNMWYSMVVDTLPRPEKVVMRGARKEARTFTIGAWKDFSGTMLPTLDKAKGRPHRGERPEESVPETAPIQKDACGWEKRNTPDTQAEPGTAERVIRRRSAFSGVSTYRT